MQRVSCSFLALCFAALALGSSIPQSPQKEVKSEKQTLPAEANHEEFLPNWRKILYPSYPREPYGAELYSNLDVVTQPVGVWGPMYKYNDIFDRPMRSALKLEQMQPISDDDANLVPLDNLPFIPFYSGILKGRR